MSGMRFKDGKWVVDSELPDGTWMGQHTGPEVTINPSYWEDYKPQPNRKERRAEAAKKRRKR